MQKLNFFKKLYSLNYYFCIFSLYFCKIFSTFFFNDERKFVLKDQKLVKELFVDPLNRKRTFWTKCKFFIFRKIGAILLISIILKIFLQEFNECEILHQMKIKVLNMNKKKRIFFLFVMYSLKSNLLKKLNNAFFHKEVKIAGDVDYKGKYIFPNNSSSF